jgi:MFS transporter, DHA1 family, tetracycline resistance protein
MNRKSLAGLFVCNLVVFCYGNGFLPLMPLYAKKFGATNEVAGYYVALAYLFLAAGTFLGGRLSDGRMNRRGLLAAFGSLAVPLTWLLGKVSTIWQLTLVNGAQWLALGACLALVGSIAGRDARAEERGKVFGILGTTISLGSLAGGLTVGRMADAWGYPVMLWMLAGLFLLIPAAAFLAIREAPSPARNPGIPKPVASVPLFSAGLLILLAAEILTMVSNGEGNLGRSLAMSSGSFSGAAITETAAIGGVVSLPLPFLMGWLSDRVGRKPMMIACSFFGAASLLLLLVSHSWWAFCSVAALNSLMTIGLSVGPAMIADVVRRERVGTGISFFQSSVWVGMIIGFSGSGIAFQRLGIPVGLEAGAVIALLAVPLFLAGRAGRSASRSAAVART